MDRVYHHRIACLFRVRSSLKNVRLPRCPAWRPADFYHLCDPDFHGNLAGCIRQCDRCLSRTWIYRQLYTGLSYDLLQNFIMAFPLQLIFVGPLARLIFRTLFINHKKEKTLTRFRMTMRKSLQKQCKLFICKSNQKINRKKYD